MILCAADTSPLIAFSGIGRLDVLRAVFEEVLVLPTVFAEIVTQGGG
jgi:predicted nucleic acid-binding protein